MTLANLGAYLAVDTAFADAADYTLTSCDFALPESVSPLLVAEIYRRRLAAGQAGALLVIAATSREAAQAGDVLQTLLPEAEVVELPAWETLPHERLSPAAETTGKRFLALARLRAHAGTHPLIVVASVRAVLQPVSPVVASAEPLILEPGFELDSMAEFARTLVSFGYERVDLVVKRGQFALRGGIVDIFVSSAPSAVRIDLFGDEIESLSEFAVSDQLSSRTISQLQVWPARELLLDEQVRSRAAQLVAHAAGHTRDMLDKVAAGHYVEGMESLLPQLVDRQFALTELLPANSFVAVLSPDKVASRAVSLAETNREFLAAAWQQLAGADADLQPDSVPVAHSGVEYDGLFTLMQVRAAVPELTWHTLSPFTQDAETSDAVVVAAAPIPQAGTGEASTHMAEFLRTKNADGYVSVLVARASGAAERAAEVLADAGVAAQRVKCLPANAAPGCVYIVTGFVHSGFELPAAKIVVVTEAEFFGRELADTISGAVQPARRRKHSVVDPLQLQAGDYVVHETHGIGKFKELTQLEVPGAQRGEKLLREYLVLEYAAGKRGMPADVLYVPTDQLGQLSRYVGADTPALSKMGGSDWANAKKKARKAVREIAIELVKLYAERAQAQGFAFSPDTPWQRELEESFAYMETPDQLNAIADVKRDMELPRPMDRLISGDVGFGKTEIALRAAFKAVQDNKQVAVLVPTTLLVRQHYETFAQRFAPFPVRLRALSRFQSDKEAREVIQGLQSGDVDVVIGTHRLLAKGVEFKDLGLIIIDEEQRFGVEHKESLKELKHNVDVLAMSATPIPRTLEMAVTGIREMSQLTTAPEDRHPILTFVGQRNDGQIAAAIRREMLREGQVFYVHNRVSSITRVAKRIAESVPEARVAVAHGRLTQAQLEQVVVDFWERKYDVLVTTTIIETGLDIANANTIIIDGADKYGLSQLHQLRGRVGRSRERAYAYFLYEPDRVLTEHAHERLQTIATHNELGSGMQVALKDLELRGAGNLLGGEQSGHISGVGFDLYLRMIGEAVDTFKGVSVHENRELTIELPVDARIPESYLDSERLRLEVYQKLSAAAHPNAQLDSIDTVCEQLIDRYGKMPPQVLQLVELTRLRRKAAELGVERLWLLDSQLRIEPLPLPDSRQMRLQRLYPGSQYRLVPQRSAASSSAEDAQPVRAVVSVPLPAAFSGSMSAQGSPFDRGAKAADQALDGDLVAWVMRVFGQLTGEN